MCDKRKSGFGNRSNLKLEGNIPEEFYSFETGLPFKKCLVCESDLHTCKEPYFIEKAYKTYADYKAFDVIHEYAICMPCALTMSEKMSRESRQRIENFFHSRIDFVSRFEEMSEGVEKKWTDYCLVNGTSRNENSEFVIYGMFHQNQMIKNGFPYMLGNKAMNEMTELLSNETRDEYDRFIDDYFIGPPEVKNLIKGKPIILV